MYKIVVKAKVHTAVFAPNANIWTDAVASQIDIKKKHK